MAVIKMLTESVEDAFRDEFTSINLFQLESDDSKKYFAKLIVDKYLDYLGRYRWYRQ